MARNSCIDRYRKAAALGGRLTTFGTVLKPAKGDPLQTIPECTFSHRIDQEALFTTNADPVIFVMSGLGKVRDRTRQISIINYMKSADATGLSRFGIWLIFRVIGKLD